MNVTELGAWIGNLPELTTNQYARILFSEMPIEEQQRMTRGASNPLDIFDCCVQTRNAKTSGKTLAQVVDDFFALSPQEQEGLLEEDRRFTQGIRSGRSNSGWTAPFAG